MFVSDIFGTVLGKANPFVKQDVFGWMGANLMESKPIAKEELTACLAVLYVSLEDRSGDAKKASRDVILGFMKHLGFQSIVKATEKLSAVSKIQLPHFRTRQGVNFHHLQESYCCSSYGSQACF